MSASNNTAATAMFVAAPGKCAQLHSLWQHTADAQAVSILPRKDAVKLAEERGFNPATARTQFQVWFKRHSAAVPPAGTEEFAAHIPQSQQEPAAPAADPAPAVLTRAQKKALAKSQAAAAVA